MDAPTNALTLSWLSSFNCAWTSTRLMYSRLPAKQLNSSCYCQYEPFNIQPTEKHCQRLNFVGIHAMTKKLQNEIHPNGQCLKSKLRCGGTDCTLLDSYIQVLSPWSWAFFYHCNNMRWGTLLSHKLEVGERRSLVADPKMKNSFRPTQLLTLTSVTAHKV